MIHKIRLRKAVSFLIAFVLLLTLAPLTAFAMNGTAIYKDAGKRIDTGYGIVECRKPGSRGFYRLQVRIKLNGREVYASDWLKVGAGLPGSLKFTPKDGKYELQTPNSYEASTMAPGSTWVPSTGQLSIVGLSEQAREFDNVLTINLVSFSDKVTLDVERRPGALLKNLLGYRISYTLEGTEYAYNCYGFGAVKALNIPADTKVTVTAICKSPFEAAKWSACYTRAGKVKLEGINGEKGREAYGNEVYLSAGSGEDARILLYVANLGKANISKEDYIDSLHTGRPKDDTVNHCRTDKKMRYTDVVSCLVTTLIILVIWKVLLLITVWAVFR